jgi:hypothetical protein
MPPWVSFVISVLGILISLGALIVSWKALKHTSPLTELQKRLAYLELRDRQRNEVARAQADIRAELGVEANRIFLLNVGPAPAFRVDIEFLDEKGRGLLPEGEREEKLPVPRLDPGDSVALLAAFASGRWPPFEVALSWRDPDDTAQRRKVRLYES